MSVWLQLLASVCVCMCVWHLHDMQVPHTHTVTYTHTHIVCVWQCVTGYTALLVVCMCGVQVFDFIELFHFGNADLKPNSMHTYGG